MIKKLKKMSALLIMPLLMANMGQPSQALAALTEEESLIFKMEAKNYADIIEQEYYKPVNTDDMFSQTAAEAETGISFDKFMKLFVSKLNDKYSEYFNKDEIQSFTSSMSGEYYGIGVEVSKDKDTGGILIKRVFETSPAKKAGVRVNDIIIKVNDKDISTISLSDAVTLMKGEKGTSVELGILRDGEDIKLNVMRDEIKMDSVVDNFNKKTKIGYLSVRSFLNNTDEAFDEKLTALEKKGMKGLIIDLRNNGGGTVDSAYNMANRILKSGKKIFSFEYKGGKKEDYFSKDENGKKDRVVKIPIYILINNNSASASELFTGALADNKAAKTVGEKSFGKGVAQSIFTSSDIFGNVNSGLKITTLNYYLPNGESINNIGITPQYEVRLSVDDKKDKQLKKAEALLKKDLKKLSKK